ncbi:SDR family NAD(P)-dependent oxidoreductase, partial [Streptomyces sp. A7024]
METAGKTAVVTGGATGIGAAVAARLADDGAKLAIVDHDPTAGEATARALGAVFVPADLSDRSNVTPAMRAATAQLGGIDILVNNAGGVLDPGTDGAGGVDGPYYPHSGRREWGAVMELNLLALMLCTQLALASMTQRGGGAIVNMASIAGLGTDPHRVPEYAAAKAAVIRLTAGCAPLRESAGVRVNCVCPDMVDTPSSRRVRATMSGPDLDRLPPVLAPEDIASAVVRLIADESLAGRALVCPGGAEPY